MLNLKNLNQSVQHKHFKIEKKQIEEITLRGVFDVS